MRKIIEQTIRDLVKGTGSQFIEMAEKKVIATKKMCAVEGRHGTVRFRVSFVIRSVVREVLNKGVIADHKQKAAMRAVVDPAMITTVSKALLENGELMATIAIFMSNYVEKELIQVKKGEEVSGLRNKIRKLAPSRPTSDPSENDDKPFTDKRLRRFCHDWETIEK